MKHLISEPPFFDDHSKQLLPVCFVWPYEDKSVFLSTNYDDWEKMTPLHTTLDFPQMHCVVKMPIHQTVHFRYHVDGALKCDPAQAVVRGEDGGFVNELFVRPNHLESFFPRKSEKKVKFSSGINGSLQDFQKLYERFQTPEAPRHYIQQPDDQSFSSALHNHVYKCNIKDDGVLCLSMCQHINEKRVLTVYYKPARKSPMQPMIPPSNV